MAKPKFTRQMTEAEFGVLFHDADACKVYLAERRWPEGIYCPRCGSAKAYALATRPFHWQCHARSAQKAGDRFSVLVGTVFENTKVPMRRGFRIIYLMLTSKKGVSALQIHRMMGFGSYETARFMCMRVRAAVADPDFRKLMGIVEVDETYVGGKNRNRHHDKRIPSTGSAGKQIVMGAVERQGSVVARVIRNTDTATMEAFVREAVSTKVDLISKDEHSGYRSLGREFAHQFVRHSKGGYVGGPVHTQTIDGFWSLLKRGIMGTFHKISAKYLPLYVAEFE